MDRPSAEAPRGPMGKPLPKTGAGAGPALERPRSLSRDFKNRLISGLVFCLPIAITFSIVYWLFTTLQRFVLDPAADAVNRLQLWARNHSALQNFEPPDWWARIASPVLAIALGILVLYFLGLALRSWVYRTIDWVMLRVPIVATIYRAARNVVESLSSQFQGESGFKRVVLVEFPHPGMRSLGLVTNALRDETTGRTILTVCVLTGVMPPSGFTLFVPEESATNVSWSVNETLQAILSGGITSPSTIHYFRGPGGNANAAASAIAAASGGASRPAGVELEIEDRHREAAD